MGGLFGKPTMPTITAPPPAPSLADTTVQEAATESQKTRKGRASTMLTDPQAQREAETTKQSYLTGA